MKSFPQIEKYEEQINLSSSSKWSVAGLVDNMLLVALERECNMCYSQTCYKCYKITCKSHLALVSNQQLQDVPKNKATTGDKGELQGWGEGRGRKEKKHAASVP